MPKEKPAPAIGFHPEFYRAREVAYVLGVSESQARDWMRDGTLRTVRLPGIRAVRAVRADVEARAREWARSA